VQVFKVLLVLKVPFTELVVLRVFKVQQDFKEEQALKVLLVFKVDKVLKVHKVQFKVFKDHLVVRVL
jgi:hypothetical protein